VGTQVSITETPFLFITDSQRSKGRDNLEVVRSVLEGGVRWVQYREPDLNDSDSYNECVRIKELCDDVGAGLVINKRLDVAALVRAEGVHLGKGSLPIRVVREYMGEDFMIGYSAHTLTEALTAEWEGASYIVLAPIFKLTHKESPFEPHGIEGTLEILAKIKVPVFLLGGIRFDNLAELVENIHPLRIAAVSMLSEADDITTAAENVMRILEPSFNRDDSLNDTEHSEV